MVSVKAQEILIDTPTCVIDSQNPTRNILELTGNQSNTHYKIQSMNLPLSPSLIYNCHIYIHDLQCRGIEFLPSLIEDSNITIVNVISTTRNSPVFIRFNSIINKTGFVFINNISHSSLQIGTNTTDDISAVRFSDTLAGNTLSFSTNVFISNIIMENISCDRVSDSTSRCTVFSIFFATVFNVLEMNITNLFLRNVNLRTASSLALDKPSEITTVKYSAPVFIRRITIKNMRVEDAKIENLESILNFQAIIFNNAAPYLDATPSTSRPPFSSSSLTLANLVFRNITCIARSTVRLYLVVIGTKVSDFGTIKIVNVTATGLNAVTRTNFNTVQVFLIFISKVIVDTARAASEKFTTSVLVDSVVMSSVNASAVLSTSVHMIYAAPFEGYDHVNISNLRSADMEVKCPSQTYFFVVFVTSNAVAANPGSKFILENIKLRNVSLESQSTGLQVTAFKIFGFEAYEQVQISNIEATKINVTSRSGSATLRLIIVEETQDFPALSSTSSLLLVENVFVRDVILQTDAAVEFTFLKFGGSVSNVNEFLVRNVITSNVKQVSTAAAANFYFATFFAEIDAGSQSASTSVLAIENFRLENISSVGKTHSDVLMVYFGNSVSNYRNLSFRNFVASGLSSSCIENSLAFYALYFAQKISAPSFPPQQVSWNTNFVISNISLVDCHLFSPDVGVTFRALMIVQDLVNFDRVELCAIESRNISAVSQYSAFYLASFAESIIAPKRESALILPFSSSSSSSSSLFVHNINVVNVSTFTGGAIGGYDYWTVVRFSGPIVNYSSIHFANISCSEGNATSTDSSSSIIAVKFDPSAPIIATGDMAVASSIIFENIRFFNMTSYGNTRAVIFGVYFTSEIANYNFIAFTNISAETINTTGKLDAANMYLVRIETTLSRNNNNSFILFNSLRISSVNLSCGVESQVCLVASPASNNIMTVSGFDFVELSESSIENVTINLLLLGNNNNNNSILSNTRTTIRAMSALSLQNCFQKITISNNMVSNINVIRNNNKTNNNNNNNNNTFIFSFLKVLEQISNVSEIQVRNNTIRGIFSLSSVIEIYTTDILMSSSMISRNSAVLFQHNIISLSSTKSSSASTSLSSSVSVALLPFFFSELSSSLQITIHHCLLEIVSDDWQNACTSRNCTLVRFMDDFFDNTTTFRETSRSSSNISFVGNSIVSLFEKQQKLSLVSFPEAIFVSPSPSDEILLRLSFHDNFLNVAQENQIISFNTSLSNSNKLEWMKIEIGCNKWNTLAVTLLKLHFFVTNPAATNLIQTTCPTSSESDSLAISETFITSTQSSTDDSTSSSSLSMFDTFTKSPPHSPTGENSKTDSRSQQTLSSEISASFSGSSSASAIVLPPPFVSPMRPIYQTTTTVASFVSILSFSSSSTLSAVRTRSVLRHFDSILYGECGLADAVASQEEEVPDVSDSPTLLHFKDGGYATGLIFGNIGLIVGLGIVWFVAWSSAHPQDEIYREENGNNSSQKTQKKKNKKQKSTEPFLYRFSASQAQDVMFFFANLVLEPTLTSGASILLGGVALDTVKLTPLRIVSVVAAWGVMLLLGIGVPIWRFVFSRKSDEDYFEPPEIEDNGPSAKWILRRFVDFLTVPSGKWVFIGTKSRAKFEFEMAHPYVESYTPKFPKFIVCDIGVIVFLSLAQIIGYIISISVSSSSSSPENSCAVRGYLVCVAVICHIFLVLKYWPLYVDRLSNYAVVLVEIPSLLVIVGALIAAGSASHDIIDRWSKVAVALSIAQAAVTAIDVCGFCWPLLDQVVEKVKGELRKMRNRNKKKNRRKARTARAFTLSLTARNDGIDDNFNGNQNDDETDNGGLLQEMLLVSTNETKRKVKKSKKR